MRFIFSLKQLFIWKNRSRQMLPISAQPNPRLTSSQEPEQTPIRAPASLPIASAGEVSSTMNLISREVSSDAALLMPGKTIQEEEEELRKNACTLFFASILLTIFTCGIAIPALLATYSARRILRRRQHVRVQY